MKQEYLRLIQHAAAARENAYAERSALSAAVSAGKRHFSAIAIAAGKDPTPPCGICRQALAEFGELDVLCANWDGSRCRMFSLRELLPEGFSLSPPASPKG